MHIVKITDQVKRLHIFSAQFERKCYFGHNAVHIIANNYVLKVAVGLCVNNVV